MIGQNPNPLELLQFVMAGLDPAIYQASFASQ
jgi:hypothetical protein